MSSDKELKIVIKADGSVAVTELNKVGKEVTDLGRTTKKSGDDLKKYKMSWADLATGVNQAWEMLNKTKQLVETGWEFAEQGAKLRESRDAFDNYARSVGQSSDKIIAKLKDASGGTIDDMGLIVAASKAMSLGVTKDADKMANLLQIARNKARLFGMETSQAFEDIVTGIGRASPLILDNLGIRIPAGFEKLTEGMSDAEKVSKLFEMTLDAGNKQLEAMGDVVLSKADKVRKLSASFTNLKATGGEFVFDVLEPEVTWLTNAISETDKFITKNNGLNTSFSTLIDTTELVVGTFATWKILNLAADIGSLALKVEWLTKAQLALNVAMSANPYVVVATALAGVGIYLKQVSDETEEWNKYADETNKKLKDMGPNAREAYYQMEIGALRAKRAILGTLEEIDNDIERRTKERAKRLKAFLGDAYQLPQDRSDPGTVATNSGGYDGAMADLYAKRAKIQQLNSEIEKLENERADSFLGEFGGEFDDFFKELDNGIGILDEASTGFDALGGKVKTTSKALKEAREVYIGLLDATAAHYQMNRDVLPTIENLGGGLLSVVSAMEDMIDVTGVSGNELLKIPFFEVAEQAANLANSIDLIKAAMGSGFDQASMSMAKDAVSYMQKGMVGYFDFMAAGQQRSVWDAYGGNILSTIWGAGSETQDKKEKEKLSKTIAEAVSTGFANADFSNFSLTLGNILTSVLSKSMSSKFPVLNAGGGVNWGNLGINLGVSAVSSLLTRPGRFFGGREERGKEAVQQSADLKTNLSNAYLESFKTDLLPFLSDSASETVKLALADARRKIFGTSVGYTWEDSGNGIWSDLTRTYQMVDQGASAALEALNKAIKSADSYNREVERSIEILVASGQDFAALQQQTIAYQKAAEAADYARKYPGIGWSDGSNFQSDLSEDIHKLIVTSEELVRQLGSATAQRTSIVTEGFSSYAPWLDAIPLPFAQSSGLRITPLPGHDGPRGWSSGVPVENLAMPELFDAFSALQTSFLDRNISPYALDMVKQAGTNRYELEALKFSDEDAYQKEFVAYLDRQLSIFEEVMRRQEEIFANEAKTYEERAAALEDLERTFEAYNQAKLQKLQREKQLEEEEKRLMAEQSMAKIEAGLSFVGELSKRGDRVYLMQGGNIQDVIDELMIQFADSPDMIAVLRKAMQTANSKAIFG